MDTQKSSTKNVQKRYFTDDAAASSSTAATTNNIVNKKQSKKFSGEVIKVSNYEKPFKKYRKKSKKFKLNPEAIERHSRGEGINEDGVKTDFFKEKLKRKEVYVAFTNEQAARTEILRTEEDGFIEPDDYECTAEYNQDQIAANVDITAATKHFKLNLDFGPYRMNYTKNGRHLLLGGRKGHVAAFDWVTKRLHCEMNVTEDVFDVAWLHIETMFAVAQKNWVHFYDNQGTELHCVKRMNRVTRMEFLPYHFLLMSANDEGYLSWLDVSIGELAAQYNSKLGGVRVMCQNPYNGVMCIGNSKGVVSMWSPTSPEPLAKLLCHRTTVAAMAVDPNGTYIATSGLDKSVKIWDIRSLSGPTTQYKTNVAVNEMAVSQKGLLALGMGNVCEIYKKPNTVSVNTPYLRQRCADYIHGMQFCNFEDVLGVATRKGYESLLVPGAGEANFDAIEANPYQTKSQRREYEVHALLDKIPKEFIALDPNTISSVDVPTFKEKIDAQKKLLYLKPQVVDFTQKNKMKGKGGSANAAKAKKIVKDSSRRQFGKEMLETKKQLFNELKSTESSTRAEEPAAAEAGPKTVLDRFKTKIKKK